MYCPRIASPQPWLDQEREAAFDQEIEQFCGELRKGMTPALLFQDAVSFIQEPEYREQLARRGRMHRESIDLRFCKSPSASLVAGKEITRPVFIITDETARGKIWSTFDGNAETSNGTIIPGYQFAPASPWSRTGLLLARDNDLTIGHEIHHTIDPHLDERRGQAKVIAEMFANYNRFRRESRTDWNGIHDAVSNYYFYQKCLQDLTEEEQFWRRGIGWEARTDCAILKAQELEAKYGSVPMQRMIVQARTLEELYALR